MQEIGIVSIIVNVPAVPDHVEELEEPDLTRSKSSSATILGEDRPGFIELLPLEHEECTRRPLRRRRRIKSKRISRQSISFDSAFSTSNCFVTKSDDEGHAFNDTKSLSSEESFASFDDPLPLGDLASLLIPPKIVATDDKSIEEYEDTDRAEQRNRRRRRMMKRRPSCDF
mmetsp:Transcript_32958/g.46810  ORF Transcript_32958/g.46810 Transcript_32958/m.46810 type:complete len:171 (+) Transcript_32958:411-923(+)|eukprot:CAMPEP_0202472326 /NCGR_PEP_ID=MMETSP1360-20130828/87374_1 /ASSEMBLY_ACC=CAM_ASM_000848 /TAXON_ID=515479 /ORGANISM="Licmophora paradoxa, Strain CCMP2313" /LENGTH=170 /DNA_ID=CAMNT_0049098757 /DNA_START=388 /DNA_END=900 /DNA_ORIENTATION=-